MNRIWALSFFTGLLAVPGVLAQPSITSVTNAASLAPTGAPNQALAQGVQFVIAGANLGPAEPASVSSYPYPTADGLSGVTVKATVGGTPVDVILVSVSATSVTAVLPSSVAVGTGQVTLTFDGASASSPITVVAANAGLFSTSGGATGLANASVVADDGSLTPVTVTSPARPGQKVALQATGLGAVASDEAGAPVTADLPVEVDVRVGGQKANVVSKGRAGLAPGIDQITIEIPDGFNACNVPVAVRVAGFLSNFVSLPIAPDGPCPDNAYTQADIDRILSQGEIRSGAITLLRVSSAFSAAGQSFEITSESASASFSGIKILSITASQLQGGSVTTSGSCVVSVSSTNPGATPSANIETRVLDAGSSLTLTGPKGDKPMPRQQGFYTATFPPPGIPIPGAPAPVTYFDAGDYTITGTGGADVGAFTAKTTLGAPLNWTNRATVGNAGNDVIDRSQDMTVTWTGGLPADTVSINGSTFVQATRISTSFQCLEKASAGSFTVPSWVLSAMVPSPTGTLIVGIFNSNVPFTAPGIDAGIVIVSSAAARTITYR